MNLTPQNPNVRALIILAIGYAVCVAIVLAG